MKRWDLINSLIKENGYRRYLEIGLRDGRCFKRVEAEYKRSVDPDYDCGADYPMPSRKFWREYHGDVFDLIFVDGSHLCEDVYYDLEQAIHWIYPNGRVLVHDLRPETEEQAGRIYDGKSPWCGDGWKAWIYFRARHRYDLCFRVHDFDWGIGEIWLPPLEWERDKHRVNDDPTPEPLVRYDR